MIIQDLLDADYRHCPQAHLTLGAKSDQYMTLSGLYQKKVYTEDGEDIAYFIDVEVFTLLVGPLAPSHSVTFDVRFFLPGETQVCISVSEDLHKMSVAEFEAFFKAQWDLGIYIPNPHN